MRLLFYILLVQIMAWFPATCRLLPPHHYTSHQLGTTVSTKSVDVSCTSKHVVTDSQVSEAGSDKGMNQVGSRPPNCEHKCDGCNPCIAIQSPTITQHLGIQFANYEPESWKCKCGPSVYSP